MALTTPHGPLGSSPAGWYSQPIPSGLVYVEPHPRRVQAILDGRLVIDTEQALMVHRPDKFLRYAFPLEVVGELPHRLEPTAPGYALVPWASVDTWIEEGRILVNYPINPYHRVDCRPSSRRLHVTALGVTLVDTSETMIVFETTLKPRLYVSPDQVAMGILQRSTTSSFCDYKGRATYWSVRSDDDEIPDIAWSYDDPPPESLPIKGFLSFDADLVEVSADLPGT
ncbi:DUF427 domain-containing protein [Mycolicibacterium peregrinum]|uniref:DUF427 domain-containing protein n=1 Tax=Mycolicibacterium peregrinum TaxID=43304 RepID=A0A4Z0HSZ6_MYCPR|nr:DUF427 domain-containing protein [Mycolicibacterium peregrinum]TGB43077.1 DUF427 domain-containing protein [Mycolicibacterium peregrinum]TGB44152.1 DUF427 domain-containing protein [Mycolicibacterium peregrinum]